MNFGDLFNLSSSAATLVALLSIAFGLLNCFFGYRLFKFMLGVYGFLLGALVGALVAGGVAGGQAWVLIVGAVIGGIVGAALMVLLYLVGVFVVGAVAGMLLANAVGAVLGIDMPTLVVIILAVVVGIVALILQRVVLVLATAFSGAWAVVGGGAALFSGQAVSLNLFSPSGSWLGEGAWLLIVLAAWLLLGIVGAFVQFRTTADKEPASPVPSPPAEPRDRW